MANYNEAFLGDLSDDYLNPTAHEFFPGELVLFRGSNLVTGSTIGGGNPPGDRDFFTFEVPSGFTVSNIILKAYQWGDGNQSAANYGDSYFALTQGRSFPSITDDSTYLVSKLIDNFASDGSEVGGDLLDPGVGKLPTGKGGSGQLGPGVYSVWYQETGADTTYEFDVQLEAPANANFGQIQFATSAFAVDEDAGTFNLTLTRTGGSDGNVGVVLRRLDGTATNLVDFNFHPVTAIFKQGETSRTFSYPIVDDTLIEGNETAIFELVTPEGGVVIGSPQTSTLTILDADSPSGFQFEAEALTLDTYLIEDNAFASGGKLVSFKNTPGTTGTASTQFTGKAGDYYILVNYVDETDGRATLDFQVNGSSVDSWTLDKNLGSNNAIEQTFTERLIQVRLEPGNTLSIKGTKNGGEETRVDSIQIIPNDEFIQIEAEAMQLDTYQVEDNSFASDNKLISLRNASGRTGTASTQFTGQSGSYDITVGYLDETDGQSTLSLQVNGTSIDSWLLNKNLGSSDPLERTFTERTIKGMSLNAGSTLTLTGTQNQDEWARIDFIRITPSITGLTTALA